MHEDRASIDLRSVLATNAGQGAIWTLAGEELNVNLVVWGDGRGVDEHINSEVEVLLLGIEGEGTVTIDGEQTVLRGGQLMIIPKGSRRAIRATSERFAYLSCHRRRGGLMPTPRT